MQPDLEKLKFLQEELSKQIVTEDRFDKDIKTIAGCDVAFKEDNLVCAIVVLDYKTLKVKEEKVSSLKVSMPYVPGYLSFREGPAILKTYRMLTGKPDVLMFDGNGILHPRKIGIASHMGVLLNIVTVGVAKSLLLGDVKGDKVFVNDELMAIKLQTKKDCNPIYISPGHKISLKTSVDIVKHCLKSHKLPEPIRLAHLFASRNK